MLYMYTYLYIYAQKNVGILARDIPHSSPRRGQVQLIIILMIIMIFITIITVSIINVMIHIIIIIIINIIIIIMKQMGSAPKYTYGQFSEFHVCFCGLDSGNLKFETVRTNKQHACL